MSVSHGLNQAVLVQGGNGTCILLCSCLTFCYEGYLPLGIEFIS